MNKHNLQVGQTVYISQWDRTKKESVLQPYTIKKVGRKYFELDGYYRTKFDIETLREVTQYGSADKVYLSVQEWEDEQEWHYLESKLKEHFRYNSKLTLDQLRRIQAIVNEEVKP